MSMASLSDAVDLVRHLGLGWTIRRARYAVGRRLGFLRRSTPAVAWETVPNPAVRITPLRIENHAWDTEPARREAEAIVTGRFRLFSDRTIAAGFPPDWHRNQLSGQVAPVDAHWSRLGDFAFGDIKGVWELSRFGWVFPLARSYARTGDRRWAESFWRLFSDWCENNPPNLGPNWMCGQEATFRLMALGFGCGVFGVAAPQRVQVARFVVATGRRIAGNIDYALNQQNNHGVSECVGLITAGLMVPDHDEAPSWFRQGLAALQRQLGELVYADGGFSQHSLVYHRVLLHDLCWVRHRLVAAGERVPPWLDAAGSRATDFLAAIVDPETGAAPLFGTNDGANVLPLSDGDFTDFRPTVQLASAMFRRELRLPVGPWDEAVAWMVPDGNRLHRQPAGMPRRFHAPEAGLFQLTAGRNRIVMRCPVKFRHRPAQADMLHVDVWLNGQPIATDGGSFSYNSTERFTTLGSAREHNVLTFDRAEPMRKAGRFLYLPWPTGHAVEAADGGFIASHDGYRSLGVTWNREVRARDGGGFVVRDRVTGAAGKKLRWHWRLADRDWQLSGDGTEAVADGCGARFFVRSIGAMSVSAQLIRADAASASGWRSTRYGAVEPAWGLIYAVEGEDDLERVTEFFTVE